MHQWISTTFVARSTAAAADRAGDGARAPLVLTDGIVASPAPVALVDLGGAAATLPDPLTERVDADRTGTGQAAVPCGRDVDRSESGGNQSGGATEALSLPGLALAGPSARRGVG